MKKIGLKILIKLILILIILLIISIFISFFIKSISFNTLFIIPDLLNKYTNSIKLTFILNTSVILLTTLIGFFISLYVLKNKKELILKYFIPYPHISFAIGILFFFSTSGLMYRLLNIYYQSDVPLSNYLGNNEFSILYVLSLTFRELPFFILVSIITLNKINFLILEKASENLKLTKFNFYMSVIFPLWVKRMILPILIIISFSYSNYEYSFILGTQFPELLNQELINIWKNEFHKNENKYIGLSLIIVICFIFTYIFFNFLVIFNKYLSLNNTYRKIDIDLILFGKYLYIFLILIFFLNFAVLLINSLSVSWFFPNLIPNGFTIQNYLEILNYNLNLITFSLIISIFLSILSTLIFITYYQMKSNIKKNDILDRLLLFSIIIILVIPQNILLINFNSLSNFFLINNVFICFLLSLIIFIFPYTYLILREKYSTELYKELFLQKKNLKLSNYKFFISVIFPIYKDTVIFVILIGFSVCYYQFLQSIFISNGSIRLFNNEVMVLFSGESAQLSSAAAIINLLPCLLMFKYLKLNNVKM